jgi:hypothetical protein
MAALPELEMVRAFSRSVQVCVSYCVGEMCFRKCCASSVNWLNLFSGCPALNISAAGVGHTNFRSSGGEGAGIE